MTSMTTISKKPLTVVTCIHSGQRPSAMALLCATSPAMLLAGFLGLPVVDRPTFAVPGHPTVVAFAASIAVAGDQILIGRPGIAARGDAPAGGVYVFQRNNWAETAVLVSKDITLDEQFGASLAVDGAMLAVGAPGADGGRGAIYLFERERTGRWIGRARLTAVAGASEDSLGRAVALRHGLLLAGAPGHARNRGAAVVFRQGADTKTWTQQANLPAPDTTQPHRFGWTLAVAGDRVFVAAPGLFEYYQSWLGPVRAKRIPGQIVVFRDSSQTWVEEARLAVTDPSDTAATALGAALVVDDTTVWASSTDAGAVYEFQRTPAGRWSQTAAIKPAGTSFRFGAALARAGRDLIVGAPGNGLHSDEPGIFTGGVYVFRSDASRAPWTEVQYFRPPTAVFDSLSWFGRTLAADQHLLVVGAPRGVSYQADNDGFAEVYRLDAGTGQWRETRSLADTAWNPWDGRPVAGAARPCTVGKSNRWFDCQNVDLLSYLPAAAMGLSAKLIFGGVSIRVNDLWGWSDSATKREFALVGQVDGTAFVEVTDPVSPRYLGKLSLHQGAQPSLWRDIKVYRNHAFIVADGAGAHGMQVFDLTQLRNVKGAPVTFQETSHYDGISSAHNIAMNEVTGFAYVIGSSDGGQTCGGALHMIDVREPRRPTFAGCLSNGGYTHDAQCVTYWGPDVSYRGRELCFNASVDKVGIHDVTDKHNPKTISLVSYPNVHYAHQSWLSGDQSYFFLNDEMDEGTAGVDKTRTLVFNVRKLDEPVLVREFFGTTAATDHNLYVRGSYMYQANYTAGLRVIDVRDPANPREAGYFDTAPQHANTVGYRGAWTAYPYFGAERDGIVGVTSTSEGLFLVRFRHAGTRQTP